MCHGCAIRFPTAIDNRREAAVLRSQRRRGGEAEVEWRAEGQRQGEAQVNGREAERVRE